MENKICQSCGMPIASNEQLGTNKDGSINTDYCKYCYEKSINNYDISINQDSRSDIVWQCGTYTIKDGKQYKIQTKDLCKQAKLANIDYKSKC